MTPLRVEFDMTREDYEAVVAAVLERDVFAQQQFRKQRRVMLTNLAMIVVLNIVLFLLTEEVQTFLLVLTVAFGVFVVVLWPQQRRFRALARKHVAAQMRTPAGQAMLGLRVMEVSSNGLDSSTDYSRIQYHWKAVFDCVLTNDYFFLVLAGPAYLPIPRRAFESENDFHRFAEAVTDLAAVGGGLVPAHRVE